MSVAKRRHGYLEQVQYQVRYHHFGGTPRQFCYSSAASAVVFASLLALALALRSLGLRPCLPLAGRDGGGGGNCTTAVAVASDARDVPQVG